MATYCGITILTEGLGFDFNDAQRALQQNAGDVNRAADSLFNQRQRRSRSSNIKRAGPSCPLVTPPPAEFSDTIVINGDDESDTDNEGEPDGAADDEEEYVYALPTPIKTPADAITAERSDTESEEEEDDLYANSRPPRARKTTTTATKEVVESTENFDPEDNSAGNLDNATACEGVGPLCVCQEAHDEHMIKCVACSRWFHFDCVNLDTEAIPAGDWNCHFELDATSEEINRRGTKFNDLESRALYLSVKFLAPLGKNFWEDVSNHLKTQFNIVRSNTSAKLEWLRNSSAIWGFDERDARQFSETQMDERRRLMRCLIEGKVAPRYIEFRAIGQGKSRQCETAPEPVKHVKRRRVIEEDDDEEENRRAVPTNKKRRVLSGRSSGIKSVCVKSVPVWQVAGKSTGGKYVDGKPIVYTPAIREPTACKTSVTRSNASTPVVGTPDVAKAIEVAEPHNQAPIAQATCVNHITTSGTGLVDTQSAPEDANDEILLATYPTDFNDYQYCTYGPPPQFQSRFDALTEHRRYVKEMLKDIEPNLDWYEGPWEGESELLWTGAEEYSMKAMFT